MRFNLTHLPTWIGKSIGLENCKHTRTGVKRDLLGVMIMIDSHFDRSLVVYYTHSIVHAIASDNTLRCSIGSQQVSRNVICLWVMKGESENRETAICKYTNDIEIDHVHRKNHSSILHFKGAKGLLLSHIEELWERPTSIITDTVFSRDTITNHSLNRKKSTNVERSFLNKMDTEPSFRSASYPLCYP